jgi:XTP/dITP diphosphohydrolase
MQLVLASNNAKKLKELNALFEGLPIELVTQGSLGISEAEEPHITFVENALAKARHAALASGGAAIADDSGLCVDALDGAPGVISSHYAALTLPEGEREHQRSLQDSANNALLLERLQGQTMRRARFVCTLVAIRSAEDPEPLIALGRWEGQIMPGLHGSGGFGYDPLMFIPSLGQTVAELDADTKNTLSHRALAAAQMRELMHQVWRLR